MSANSPTFDLGAYTVLQRRRFSDALIVFHGVSCCFMVFHGVSMFLLSLSLHNSSHNFMIFRRQMRFDEPFPCPLPQGDQAAMVIDQTDQAFFVCSICGQVALSFSPRS